MDPLPTRITFFCRAAPILGLLGFANITNIKHDTVECAGIQGLVFVIRCDGDEQFRLPIVHLCAQRISVGLGEFVRVHCCGGVSHVPAMRSVDR